MITAKLTDFIYSLKYDQLPENVVNKAKQCFIDFLGVSLRGSMTDSGEAIKSIISTNNESTIIGNGKSSALEAGLANGVFAHSLDLDDGHRMAQLHPGTCVIPAALSLCEARNKTGKELIESIVIGYQVAISLGILVNPEHRMRGFHSTGTCGTLGAAAAACKSIDLDKIDISNALGLAGTQAAGLLISDHSGSMGKHLHAGKAAQSGILSALLAENGFTGSKTILEGDEGFISSMSGIDTHHMDLELMDKYRILEVYFKIYPVCRHIHPSIDALLYIANQENINPREIDKIKVDTYKIAAEHNNYLPHSAEALKQSLPLSLAVAFFNNYKGLDNLIELKYTSLDDLDNDIVDLSQKIEIKSDDGFNEKYPLTRTSSVSIFTKKGIKEKIVEFPLGEPENPLSKSDVYWKFKKLNPNVDIQVLEIIENMDSYNNINNFMDELISFL